MFFWEDRVKESFKKKSKKIKRENLFIRILNKVLKLKYLKMFELAIGFVKGFSIKVEFFAKKEDIK